MNSYLQISGSIPILGRGLTLPPFQYTMPLATSSSYIVDTIVTSGVS